MESFGDRSIIVMGSFRDGWGIALYTFGIVVYASPYVGLTDPAVSGTPRFCPSRVVVLNMFITPTYNKRTEKQQQKQWGSAA